MEPKPHPSDCFLQRGVVNIELRKFLEAKTDLERYLQLEPAAKDRTAVEQQIRVIEQWLNKKQAVPTTRPS